MARDNPVSRRTALKLTGAAASTALVAGCSGGGNGNGNGSGNGDSSGPAEISPDTEIVLIGEGTSWTGDSPDSIADQTNPAISLTAGETYTMTWEAGSGQHNLEIWDSNEEVVNDLSTPQTQDPGEDSVLEFEATSEMAEYVCQPHSGAGMRGDIEVTGGSSDGGSGNESSGNQSE